jgi:hypothetical protein
MPRRGSSQGIGVGIDIGTTVAGGTEVGGAGSEEHATPKESTSVSKSSGRSFITA